MRDYGSEQQVEQFRGALILLQEPIFHKSVWKGAPSGAPADVSIKMGFTGIPEAPSHIAALLWGKRFVAPRSQRLGSGLEVEAVAHDEEGRRRIVRFIIPTSILHSSSMAASTAGSARLVAAVFSTLYVLGVPDKVIQRILRHSNIAVIMDFYVKAMDPDVVAAMAKLEAHLAARCPEKACSGAVSGVAALPDTYGTVNPASGAVEELIN